MDDLDLEFGWILELTAFQTEISLKIEYCLRGCTLIDQFALNHQKEAIKFLIDFSVRLMDCH
jgi:hypothetical protein